jgi:hypothetical protein
VTREKSQYTQQKMQTAISLGATILGGLFGRKIGSTGNVGRATTTMRGVGRSMREREDIDRATHEVKVVQERLDHLEMEFEEEMAKLTETYNPEDLELTEALIRPRKSDIFISPLSLVWSPWKVGADGIAEPFFYAES